MAAVLARVQAISAAFGGGAPPVPGLPAAAGPSVNTATKLLREVYVGGLPQGVPLTASQIRDFFNLVMDKAGMAKGGLPGTPVVSARMGDSGMFAFLEMRSPEETDSVIGGLNGVPFLGAPLKLGRPKAYAQHWGSMPAAVAAAQVAGGGMPANGLVGLTSGFPGMAGMAAGLGMGGFGAFQQLAGMAANPAAAALLMGAAAAGMAPGAAVGLTSGALGGAAAPAAVVPGPPTAASILGTGTASAMPSTSAVTSAPAAPAAAPSGVAPDDATPTDVIVVTSLPSFIDADGIREIVASFGEVTLCVMVPAVPGEPADAPRTALVAYADASLIDAAIGGLNGLAIADAPMGLARAPAGLVATVLGQDSQHLPPSLRKSASSSSASSSSASSKKEEEASAAPEPTPVLELHNIVVADDLTSADPEELSDIKAEVSEEAGKWGRVADVFIPPLTSAQQAPGQGRVSVPVYVTFDSPAGAAAFAVGVRGRKFEGRTVSTRFVTSDEMQAVRGGSSGGDDSAPTSPAAEGGHGGHGGHYSSVSIQPPASYAPAASSAAGGGSGLPEDGLVLPPVPAAADLD